MAAGNAQYPGTGFIVERDNRLAFVIIGLAAGDQAAPGGESDERMAQDLAGRGDVLLLAVAVNAKLPLRSLTLGPGQDRAGDSFFRADGAVNAVGAGDFDVLPLAAFARRQHETAGGAKGRGDLERFPRVGRGRGIGQILLTFALQKKRLTV
jgi:hypothetical protein